MLQRLNESPRAKSDVFEWSNGPTVRPGHRSILYARDALLCSDDIYRVGDMAWSCCRTRVAPLFKPNEDPPHNDGQEREC